MNMRCRDTPRLNVGAEFDRWRLRESDLRNHLTPQSTSSPCWVVPHPVLARFEAAVRILLNDGREIALLAVAVLKENRRDQAIRIGFQRGRAVHLPRIRGAMPRRYFELGRIGKPRIGGVLVH